MFLKAAKICLEIFYLLLIILYLCSINKSKFKVMKRFNLRSFVERHPEYVYIFEPAQFSDFAVYRQSEGFRPVFLCLCSKSTLYKLRSDFSGFGYLFYTPD